MGKKLLSPLTKTVVKTIIAMLGMITKKQKTLNDNLFSRKALFQIPLTLPLLLLPLIHGCFMQPITLPEIHRYQLAVQLPICSFGSKTSRTLFVGLPQTTAPYDSTRMVYSLKRHEVCYFAENRWAAPLSQMLLPLFIQSMRNTQCFKTVTGFPMAANTTYHLDTSIINFKQEFCQQRSRVHITLEATLTFSATQKVIATRRIDVCVPTKCSTPASAVDAYQIALNKVLKQLNCFIIQNL